MNRKRMTQMVVVMAVVVGLLAGDAGATGLWRLRNSNSGGQADVVFQFGPRNSGWLPIAGSWDGIGVDTIGLFDPSSSIFRLRNTNDSGPSDQLFQFGSRNSGWLAVSGDFNNDGLDTVGLFDAGSIVDERNPAGDGALGFLWKPISDNTGKLVVLLPAYEFFTETEPRVGAVEIHTDSPPSEVTFVERGVYTVTVTRTARTTATPGRANRTSKSLARSG